MYHINFKAAIIQIRTSKHNRRCLHYDNINFVLTIHRSLEHLHHSQT